MNIFKPWHQASRISAGIAINPLLEKRVIVQIYCARAFSWRGFFSVHSWIAVKHRNSDHYLVYQLLYWNKFLHNNIISVTKDIPDRYWFDAKPKIIYSYIGDLGEKMIEEINQAILSYPYKNKYILWPGPNSNSFISYLIRNSSLIRTNLPANAIGKDWLGFNKFFAFSESKTGIQISIFGIFGIIFALKEGVEFNILGLSFGFSPYKITFKLPFIGDISMIN